MCGSPYHLMGNQFICSIVAHEFSCWLKRVVNKGRLVTALGVPDCCDDFSTLSTGVVIAPFKIDEGEVLKSTSSPSVADFIGAILDMWYETSQIDDTVSFMLVRTLPVRGSCTYEPNRPPGCRLPCPVQTLKTVTSGLLRGLKSQFSAQIC